MRDGGESGFSVGGSGSDAETGFWLELDAAHPEDSAVDLEDRP